MANSLSDLVDNLAELNTKISTTFLNTKSFQIILQNTNVSTETRIIKKDLMKT